MDLTCYAREIFEFLEIDQARLFLKSTADYMAHNGHCVGIQSAPLW